MDVKASNNITLPVIWFVFRGDRINPKRMMVAPCDCLATAQAVVNRVMAQFELYGVPQTTDTSQQAYIYRMVVDKSDPDNILYAEQWIVIARRTVDTATSLGISADEYTIPISAEALCRDAGRWP